jgi:hypothetical protein
MSSAERLSRIYRRLGLVEAGPETVFIAGDVVVVDAGWVFDESLIKALAGRPGVALVDESRARRRHQSPGHPGPRGDRAARHRRGRHRRWP